MAREVRTQMFRVAEGEWVALALELLDDPGLVRGLVPDAALTSDGAFKHFGIRVDEPQRHTALGDAITTRELARAIGNF